MKRVDGRLETKENLEGFEMCVCGKIQKKIAGRKAYNKLISANGNK